MHRYRKLLTLAPALTAAILILSGCSRSPEERYSRALEKGKKLMAEKSYSRAALEFQNAAQAKPKSVEPLYWMGEAALNQMLWPSAIKYYRKATEVDPRYGPAQLRLADLMLRTHNDQLTNEAESRIQKVLTGNPGDDDALVALASVRVQLGRIDDAERYLAEVLKRSPTNLKSAIAMAQVKLSQKDVRGAEQVLMQTVERSPNSPDALTALGALYASSGRYPEGEGYVSQSRPSRSQERSCAHLARGTADAHGQAFRCGKEL